ncbi:MAG: DNA-processing protein DprA [Muribaculaceae bacterium]|nr:DNA-processing protein DprA [Muribaculaceae bacterium]
MIRKDTDRTYKIALSLCHGMTVSVVRTLAERGVSHIDFFEWPMNRLLEVLGISTKGFLQTIDRQEALFKARREEEFVIKHGIRTIFMLDDDYPVLLREIPDSPVILYILGHTPLDVSPSIAMVGTRRCSSYGLSFCDSFVNDFSAYYNNALIVSGLAFGIDAASHSAALKYKLPTVAVLAHGLDTIYPSQNRQLARDILAAGGALISEYPSATRPFPGNFLQRNRIVAGLSEMTIVVESEVKGGAMSTANYAFSYNREVYALPGRYTDKASSGANMLVSRGKARIFTSVADVMSEMGWPLPALNGARPPEKNLFPELEGDAETVFSFIRDKKLPVAIDEIHMATGLSVPVLMSTLTELEFEGIIVKLPGARYEVQ